LWLAAAAVVEWIDSHYKEALVVEVPVVLELVLEYQ
jgi:hypothetical protein